MRNVSPLSGSQTGVGASLVQDPGKVENIQALRGVAALLVVWAHLKFTVPHSGHLPAILATANGAIGVDAFFVVSGFVICLAATKRHHHPLEFFLARLARISPLYLVLTLFFLAKELIHLRFPTFNSLWNSFLYLPLWDRQDYSEPVLGPGWTLSFEMWFYTVFALLLNFWNPRKVASLLPAVFAIGAVLMMAYGGAWYWPRFMFHPFTLEFAFGCLVFQTQRWISGSVSWLLLAVGLGAGLALAPSTAALGFHLPLLGGHLDLAWHRVLLWGLPCALVAAGLIGIERNFRLVLPSVLVWLGEISYSLYLTHLLSVQMMTDIAPLLHLRNLALISALTLISCLILAWLCWKFVEKPLTFRAQRWARRLSIREGSLPG